MILMERGLQKHHHAQKLCTVDSSSGRQSKERESRMHREQHSTIQMDELEDDTIAADDTHHFDPTLRQLWLPST